MSYARLLTQTATITNTAAVASADSEGNWIPGAQTTTTEPCRLERGHGGRQSKADTDESFDQGADRLSSTWLLFLGPTSAVTGRSLVTVAGKRFEVEGEPNQLSTPRGPHHIEAFLSSIE